MDFTISTDEIQKIVKFFSVVVRANAADATGRILIDVSEDGVEFFANNNELTIFYNTKSAEIFEPGRVSITYNKIKSFVASFKPWNGDSGAKDFRFTKKDDNTITVLVDNTFENGKVSNGQLNLSNYNPNLIQLPPRFEQADFNLNATIFRAATNKVLYAIDPSVQTMSSAVKGMNIKFYEDEIYFVGSNGVVLSEYKVKNISNRVDGEITLQYPFIMGLRRLIRDDTQLGWEIKGNRIAVSFDNVILMGRAYIGQAYPDYSQALDDYTDYLNVDKELLMGFLTPFMDVLDPEDHHRLTFEIKDKLIKMSNNQATFETEQDIQGGLDYSIDVNGRLMAQTVEAIQDDFILVKFSMEKDENPLIFDSSTFQDQKALLSSIKR
jgi:DNA polymerase III sliding clamp (beta) subunit (PCNA family)